MKLNLNFINESVVSVYNPLIYLLTLTQLNLLELATSLAIV